MPWAYSVSKDDDELREIDPTDGSTDSSVTISLPGETVDGATGLATQPSNGDLFAILKLGSGERVLAMVDPVTGDAMEFG